MQRHTLGCLALFISCQIALLLGVVFHSRCAFVSYEHKNNCEAIGLGTMGVGVFGNTLVTFAWLWLDHRHTEQQMHVNGNGHTAADPHTIHEDSYVFESLS